MNWFKDEACNLSKLYTNKTQAFKRMRGENQALKDDRMFLESNFRESKKKVRML